LKNLLRQVARALLGDYALYQVWRSQDAPPPAQPPGVQFDRVDKRTLEVAPETEFRSCAWYAGDEATAFGAFEGNRLLAVAWVWWGERYASRYSWPLPDRAAKLVHIVTVPAARGRGVATALIAHVEGRMRAAGFASLYARIWHSNEPSQRAFARAGWRRVGWYVEANPLRRPQPWRFCFRTRDVQR
jgi:GNAT superfamily N-acetyltransferase